MEEKLTKYHKEEIIFILLILAENLSEYENEDLVCFTEVIEGRIDELFKSEKIIVFLKEYEINNEIIQKMQVLKSEVTNLYTSQWHQKLKNQEKMQNIKILATQILEMLNISKEKPLKYLETHLFL